MVPVVPPELLLDEPPELLLLEELLEVPPLLEELLEVPPLLLEELLL